MARQAHPDKHGDSFIHEARNLLREMHDILHRLRHEPENQDLLRQICRAFRTICALGGMFHYEDLAHYAHAFRRVLERALDREVAVTHELVALCQASCRLFDSRLTTPDASDLRRCATARDILEKIYAWCP